MLVNNFCKILMFWWNILHCIPYWKVNYLISKTCLNCQLEGYNSRFDLLTLTSCTIPKSPRFCKCGENLEICALQTKIHEFLSRSWILSVKMMNKVSKSLANAISLDQSPTTFTWHINRLSIGDNKLIVHALEWDTLCWFFPSKQQ